MRVANALSVYATPLYQTWRKSSFGRLYVGEPRSSHTPSTNARRACDSFPRNRRLYWTPKD